MTIPQTTEGGETWPKDTSDLTARTTTPVQQATHVRPQIGTDAWEHKNAQLVDEKVTTQVAEPNGTTNSGAPGATETTTATTCAD